MQLIVDRLSNVGFVTIGGALEYAALRDAPGRLPAAFVVPQAKNASISEWNAVIDQKVSLLFAVVIVVGAARAGMIAIADDLEVLETKVIDRLVGWTPPGLTREIQFADASTLSVGGGVFAWGMRFRSSYHIRKGR